MKSSFSPMPAAQARPGARLATAAVFIGFSLALAGCAQEPEKAQGVWRNDNTKEFFSSKQYGQASPRLVANGRRVPKGGGRFIIGKPYKIAGKRYYPRQFKPGQTQVGKASWYGDAFHGRKTANGEIYDMSSVTAAHPTMPLPSYARVTNARNGRSIIVRVNDRGPFHGGRVIDLSKRVADLLDFRRYGVTTVKVEYMTPAGLAGSDDQMLVASLRTNGSPAQLDRQPSFPGRTLFASRRPDPKPAPAPAPQREVPAIRTSEPDNAPRATAVERTADGQTPAAPSSPLPPIGPQPASRPFDLATIPGAATPIAGPRATRDLAGVTFFAPVAHAGSAASRFRKRGPFEGVDLTGLRPLRRD